jgi:hypothetical protein
MTRGLRSAEAALAARPLQRIIRLTSNRRRAPSDAEFDRLARLRRESVPPEWGSK